MAAAGMMARIALELVLNGYSRDQEWESDAFAINYLNAVYGESARGALVAVLKKLQYSHEVLSAAPYKSILHGTHPDLPSRIVSAKESRVRFFDPPLSYPIEIDGEMGIEVLVNGISLFQQDEFVVDRRRSSGPRKERLVRNTSARLFAMALPTGSLGGAKELKSLVAEVDGQELSFDNEEDTLVLPGKLFSMSFLLDVQEEVPELEFTDLELGSLNPNLHSVR